MKTGNFSLPIEIFLFSSFSILQAQSFTEINIEVPHLYSTKIDWIDYDRDGDLDFCLSGIKVSNIGGRHVFLYRNNHGVLDSLVFSGEYRTQSTIDWADYDADGYADLIVASEYGSPIVYLYAGHDTFKEKRVFIDFFSIYGSQWLDYDHDGDLDFFLNGPGSGNDDAQFFRNEGNDVFIKALHFSYGRALNYAWGDLDNDGDSDLIITSLVDLYGKTETRLHRNQGNGQFSSLPFIQVDFKSGIFLWMDMNNDGFRDILFSGNIVENAYGRDVTKLFKNESGSGAFTEINITLDAVASYLASGDYDNDGDLDLLIAGKDSINTYLTKLFRNDGNGIFTRAALTLPGVVSGDLSWADIDNDGDLDFTLTSAGFGVGEAFTRIYRNEHTISNAPPTAPQNLAAVASMDSVILSWQPASDNATPQNQLTYNLRVGTRPGASDIISPLSILADGKRSVVNLGNVGPSTRFALKDLLNGAYYWSVQAIDHAYSGSAFSQEQTFMISQSPLQKLVKIPSGLPGALQSAAAWADYDRDGDLDVIVTGASSFAVPVRYRAEIYRNDDGIFTAVPSNIVPVDRSAVAWGDYDNDGYPDLLISGVDTTYKPRTDIYRNLGTGQFQNINANLLGLISSAVAWGDYDNDGDLDFVIRGKGSYSLETTTRIYRNDKKRKFTAIDPGSKFVGDGVAWADFDADGDLDLSVGARVYRNTGKDIFVDIGVDFTEVKEWQQSGPIIWGDYDNDGDLDLLAERTLYQNRNGQFVKDKILEIGEIGTSSSAFGDIDNDGDLDILFSGERNGYGRPAVRFVRNEGNDQFLVEPINLLSVRLGSVSFGDFDNDRDLDVLLTGEGELGALTDIYRNDGLASNQPPATPSGLSNTIQNGTVLLEWNPAMDGETPSDGLTYNISIGTTSEGTEVKSPLSDLDTGWRFVPDMGNVRHGLFWPFRPLKSGTYYWRVQAIDHGFAGSQFFQAQEFTIANTPPASVRLLSPQNADTLDFYEIDFKWTKSFDLFSDTLSYALRIFNPSQDTSIFAISDTVLHFDGRGWINPGARYRWLVYANDDQHQVASVDTFTFVKRRIVPTNFLVLFDFAISNFPDSLTIYNDRQEIITKLFWESDAVQGENSPIKVGVVANDIVPPSSGGRNYALNRPLHFNPHSQKALVFNPQKVKMRFYADTTVFRLADIISHFAVSRVTEQESLFDPVNIHKVDYQRKFVEFYVDSIASNTLYTFSALNILMGVVNRGELPVSVRNDVLIPEGKSAVLNRGVTLRSEGLYQLYSIFVKGKLTCAGTEAEPVMLENLDVRVEGVQDSVLKNNEEMANCEWLVARGFLVRAASARLKRGSFLNITADAFAKVIVENLDVTLAGINNSHAVFRHCRFDSSGYISSNASIVDVENTFFSYYDRESTHSKSYFSLKKSVIRANAFLHPFYLINCFFHCEDNKFLFAGKTNDNANRVGIGVFSGNLAVIKNNIVKGFRSAVEIDYGNKALIYNNTFVDNNRGVRLTATPDTVSVYNNIFYNQETAIDLNYSTYAGGANLTYVDHNLYKPRNPNHLFPYIDNRTPNSTVMGNSFSINADPGFAGFEDYHLSSSSPAIDQGTTIIPASGFTFNVLDTSITVGDTILLETYAGAGPDIGAYEFGLTEVAEKTLATPLRFALHQNYPNPFNPGTTIQYVLPTAAHVRIEIYDLLGKRIRTLTDKKQQAGEHTIKWDGKDNKGMRVSAGIYHYRIEAEDFVQAKKMVLIR